MSNPVRKVLLLCTGDSARFLPGQPVPADRCGAGTGAVQGTDTGISLAFPQAFKMPNSRQSFLAALQLTGTDRL